MQVREHSGDLDRDAKPAVELLNMHKAATIGINQCTREVYYDQNFFELSNLD